MSSSDMFRFPRRRAIQRAPVRGLHQLGPAPIELAVVALAEPIVADPCTERRIEAVVPKPHLRVERHAPRHRAAARLGAFLPVVHVVLLERAGRAKAPDAGLTDRPLDLRWR